jgi:hypothetical protein
MSALLNSTPKDPVTGQILAVDGTAAPEYFDNGIPYDAGKVAIDTAGTVDHFHQGLPLTATGRLVVTADAPTYFGSGAAPFADSKLCATEDSVTHYASGVPYTGAGALGMDGAIYGDNVDAGGPYPDAILDQPQQLDGTVFFVDDPSPTIAWTIDSGGTGTFLPSAAIADPTFTPDAVGPYVLRLTGTGVPTGPLFDTASLTSSETSVSTSLFYDSTWAADGIWTADFIWPSTGPSN